MALTYPIYEAKGSTSGQTGAVYGRTGGEAVGRATEAFGWNLLRVAAAVHDQQAKNESAELQAQDQEDIRNLHLWMEKNTDETTYAKKFQETWSRIEGRQAKNGGARRERNRMLPEMRVVQESLVAAQYEKRVWDKEEFLYANTKAQAIQTGRIGPATAMLSNRLQQGRISKEQADFELAEIRRQTDHRQTMDLSVTEPDEILKYKTLEEARKDYPNLGPTEFVQVRGMALGQKSFLKSEKIRMQSEHTQGLWALSLDKNTQFEDIVSAINDLPEEYFDLDEKDRLIRQETSRWKLINKGEGDPLTVRQDQNAYKELLFAATDGTATEQDVRKAVNENKITTGDYTHLVNTLKGTAKDKAEAYEFSDAVKTMDRLFNGVVGIYDVEIRETAKIKAMTMLENAVAAAAQRGRPLDGKELRKEAIRIQRRVRDQALESSTPEELLSSYGLREEFIQYEPEPGGSEPSKSGTKSETKKKADRADWVLVYDPTGTPFRIPPKDVETALQNGWRKP